MAHKPTQAQVDIIDAVRDLPDHNLMIDARAGAAKTSTLVMAAPGIPHHDFPLAVAFNKKNAEDLAERMPPHFSCRTLNAIGHGAWATARGKRLNLDADKMYKLAKVRLDAGNSEQFTAVLGLARKAKSLGIVPLGAPFGVRGIVDDQYEAWEEIAFVLGLDCDEEIVTLARTLVLDSIAAAFKCEIDFDDQIYMSTLFSGTYPKHPTVLVDESQDLSPLNHIQLQKITGRRLIAVGDPYQAIYAFRGADANSMASLKDLMQNHIGKKQFKTLTLSKSFRVPHLISKRQLDHVPDFGSMAFLPEGTVESWPKAPPSTVGDSQDPGWRGEPVPTHWNLSELPPTGFVLCRNNAPLMRLAFALIKSRRPVKIMGRDIGAALAATLLKITGKTAIAVEECYKPLEDWKRKEIEKAGDSESKVDMVNDHYESLLVLLDASGCQDNLSAAQFIKDLFSDDKNPDKLTLSSGHRAKGLEHPWVMHLDPWRVPSKQAWKAYHAGDERAMVQERNLNYVIETRTMDTLVLASLSDCEEIGE